MGEASRFQTRGKGREDGGLRRAPILQDSIDESSTSGGEELGIGPAGDTAFEDAHPFFGNAFGD